MRPRTHVVQDIAVGQPVAEGIVLALCALPLELDAILHLLPEREVQVDESGTILNVGKLPGSPWKVAVTLSGAGITSAAVVAEKATTVIKPDLALFIGIAGALKDDIDLGDVVVASKVYSYSGGK